MEKQYGYTCIRTKVAILLLLDLLQGPNDYAGYHLLFLVVVFVAILLLLDLLQGLIVHAWVEGCKCEVCVAILLLLDLLQGLSLKEAMEALGLSKVQTVAILLLLDLLQGLHLKGCLKGN